MINTLIKERINEIYNSLIKNKSKEKWLKNYNKNDKKTYNSLHLRASGRIRSALKKFKINVFFKNCHKLENMYINKKTVKKLKIYLT